jgi:hypothetical protein
MNKLKYVFGVISIVLLSSFMAPKDKKDKADEPRRVYMYGVSIDFNDSIVYITDVQHLDDILINKDGSLFNYAYYSLQLKTYLEGTLGEMNQTCAVIYSDKKKKLESRYLKTCKKYQSDKAASVCMIGTDSFMFHKE